MIETGQNMDHFYQDEDVYDPHDEKEPENIDDPSSLSHNKMKQLTLNKKSWFNQDIFKEINLSIDEYYTKKSKDEPTKPKSTKSTDIKNNPKPDNNDDKSSYEDASDDDDDEDHYDAE